jgi:hypothetical protein
MIPITGFSCLERFGYLFINPTYEFLVRLAGGVRLHKIGADTKVTDKRAAVLAHHQMHFHRQIPPAGQLTIDVITGDSGQVPAH